MTHSSVHRVDANTGGQTEGPRNPGLEQVSAWWIQGGFLEEGTFTHKSLDLSARHTPQESVNTDLWIA